MSQSSTPPNPPNPFAAFAAFTAPGAPNDPIELMKKFFAPFGLPLGGAGSTPMAGMMFPTTDPAELDKRIADLRSVETWLSLNIEVVRASVQALETQKTTLAAFNSMQSTMNEAMRAGAARFAEPAVAPRASHARVASAKPARARPRKAGS